MEREETDLAQNTPSLKTEVDSKRCQKQNVGSDPNKTLEDVVDAGLVPKQVLPFCFVKIWPKDADPNCTIQEAVRLFEEKDQQLFQISEKIIEKVFDREGVLSRLRNLKNYSHYRLNESVDGKKDLLTHLYLALDHMSFPKSCSTEKKLQNHKLNSQMQHKNKNLAQEKQLLREINMSKKRDDASTSPLAELSKIWQYDYYHYRYNQKKCDKLLKEIKQFEVTRKISKGLRKTIRNQVKVICDGLMEMRKKKRALETKVKRVEEELGAINEEIWSFQKHLKEKHPRKEATLFILQENKIDDFWTLKHCNLEYESMHIHTIYQDRFTHHKRNRIRV